MRIVSWNINGIRSAQKSGYWDKFLSSLPADFYCIQESKARPEQLEGNMRKMEGYDSYFNHPEHKKGYAGVALYVKEDFKPERIIKDFGPENFCSQGRLVGAEFDNFVLLNVYFPNGGSGEEALRYKFEFYEHFFDYLSDFSEKGKKILICGDFNIAHREIDLARPKENENSVGFLPEERELLDELLHLGFVDAWRYLHPEAIKYSWWSMRTRARERNVGWRIDYFFISENLLPFLKSCEIHNEVLGSDHCPLSLDLSFKVK